MPASAMERPGPHVCAPSPAAEEFQHDILGMSEPRIVGDAAPDDHRHDSARLEASAHVAQAGHRVLQQLRAEARKTEIMHRLERIGLYVGCQKGDIADARGARIAPPVFQQAVAASTASTEPVGPTRRASSIAVSPKPQPASITLSPSADLQRRKDFPAVTGQSAHEDVPPAHKFRHQNAVPELHILASCRSIALYFGLVGPRPFRQRTTNGRRWPRCRQ